MVSTRRGATAASDSDQPAQSAQERRGTQAASSRGASAEPRKRSTRRKASDTPQQVQPAEEASTALTTTTQNTVTTATPKITASKRRTRSTKQADSPLQTLPTTERATRKQARKQIASATAGLEQQPEVQPQQQPVEEPVQEPVQKQKQERTPEATQENAREPAQDDGENQGIFFTDHMLQENVDLQLENSRLKDENSQLKEEIDIRHEERTQMRDRIVELTTNGVHLEAQYHHLEVERDRYKDENDALMEREFDKRAVLNANDNLKSQCDKLRAFLQESQALLKEYQPSKHFADQCLAEFARYRINHMPPVEAFEHATKAGNSASSLQILHRVDAVRMALKKGALSPAHLEKIYGGAIPVDAINADYEPSPTEPIAVDPPAAENATAQIVAAEPLPEATTEPVAAPATPAAPTSFFGRALSAIKSPFAYFTAPTHAVPAPASPTPRAAPPEPESLTEVLTQTPTPVGERVRAKKKPRNPMLKALTKGLKPDEMREAEAWAKQVVAQLKNDPHKGEKRKRLEAPVLLKDLNSLPSRKPWEGGFGDPLADYDDDDVVPAWAVYADMMDEEEHKTKKHKSHHEVTMDDELPSPNESLASPSHKTVDTHGNSASLQDLHPRSARVPSPMFDNPLIHQEGGNVFKELQGGALAKQTHATDRASMLQRNEAVPHNPSHGSFSAPDPFAEDDSDISEVADADQENAPLWTQPPPAAPVPAHASLPAQRDEQTATTSSQPVDEVERQRAKLMKHTPAKPSRLREVKYPSPSVKSDAGNDSIFAATPSHMVAPSAADFKFNIPDPEPLEFDDPELAAAVRAHLESDEYKMMHANAYKGDVILTYDEEDETSDD